VTVIVALLSGGDGDGIGSDLVHLVMLPGITVLWLIDTWWLSGLFHYYSDGDVDLLIVVV